MDFLQMGDDDASESRVEISGFGDSGEIGVAAVIEISHVHPAIEHDPLPANRHDHAALADLLPCAWRFEDFVTKGISADEIEGVVKKKNQT